MVQSDMVYSVNPWSLCGLHLTMQTAWLLQMWLFSIMLFYIPSRPMYNLIQILLSTMVYPHPPGFPAFFRRYEMKSWEAWEHYISALVLLTEHGFWVSIALLFHSMSGPEVARGWGRKKRRLSSSQTWFWSQDLSQSRWTPVAWGWCWTAGLGSPAQRCHTCQEK